MPKSVLFNSACLLPKLTFKFHYVRFLVLQMENQVVVSDYVQMDHVIAQERAYILNLCKKIQKAGCNVLLVQKSILRDALSDLALHFLAKMKIMVVHEIERDDIEFICKVCNFLDSFTNLSRQLDAAQLPALSPLQLNVLEKLR